MNPAPEGKEALFTDIDTASEIGTDGPEVPPADRRRRPLAAPTATKEQIFADLNAKWAEGRGRRPAPEVDAP